MHASTIHRAGPIENLRLGAHCGEMDEYVNELPRIIALCAQEQRSLADASHSFMPIANGRRSEVQRE